MRRLLVLVLAAFAAALCLLACRETSAPEPLGPRLSAWQPPASYTVIHNGSTFRLPYPTRMVVQDSATWRWVWANTVSGFSPPPPLPAVSFDSAEVLVAVSAVNWDVHIDSVVQFQLGSRVYVTECPANSQMTINPVGYHMVRAPRLQVEDWRTVQASTYTPCATPQQGA